jgi:hypothetical protein
MRHGASGDARRVARISRNQESPPTDVADLRRVQELSSLSVYCPPFFDRTDSTGDYMITRRSVLIGFAGLPFGAALLSSRALAQSASNQFDYYISPAGNDSNPGTSSQPWSINAINTRQSTYAGKSVGLLDGTYDLSALPATSVGTKLAVASGTANSPTVIQSVNPRAAILSCSTSAAGYVAMPMIGNGVNGVGATGTPQYITLRALTLMGGSASPVSFAGTNPKSCYGLVIDSCEIYNVVNPSGAINIGCICLGTGPMGALITNCLLHDCYTNGVARSTHSNSSGVHDYANGTIVQNCTIYNCNNGIYQKNQHATPPPDGMIIRNNYILAGSAGMGIALCGFNNAYGTSPPYAPLNVYNNVFENVILYNNANDGVDGLQADLNFYNNTVYASTSTNLGCWIPSAAAYAAGVRVSVYNNILVTAAMDSERGSLTLGPSYGAWRVCNYNCYPSSPAFGVSTADTTVPSSLISLAQWQGVAGGPDRNSMTGNPGFVGPMAAAAGPNQYQLGATSACRGAGRVGGTASGAAVDAGAWGGATSIGHSFAAAPMAPVLTVS